MVEKEPTFKVVVVDDEEDLREIYAFRLEAEGIHVESFADLDSAGVYLKDTSCQVNLVITDWMMPGGSGGQVVKLAQAREVPVLVVTAYAAQDVEHELSGEGVQFLRKPFDLDMLAEAVAKFRVK